MFFCRKKKKRIKKKTHLDSHPFSDHSTKKEDAINPLNQTKQHNILSFW